MQIKNTKWKENGEAEWLSYPDAIAKLANSKETKETFVICMEEMAELTKEISKTYRMKKVEDWEKRGAAILEEMADVIISISLLKYIFDFSDEEIETMTAAKMRRNIRRLSDKGKRYRYIAEPIGGVQTGDILSDYNEMSIKYSEIEKEFKLYKKMENLRTGRVVSFGTEYIDDCLEEVKESEGEE